MSSVIILITGSLLFLICVYALVRNEWVYSQRVKLIGTKYYEKLPNYEDMVSGDKFWCWDINNFIDS